MKFSDILKNEPAPPPPPSKEPRGAKLGDALHTGADPGTAQGIFSGAKPASGAAAAPSKREEPKLLLRAPEELYGGLASLAERAAAGTPAASEDLSVFTSLKDFLRASDCRPLAFAVREQDCDTPARRALHLLIFESYLLRDMDLGPEEAAGLLPLCIAADAAGPAGPRGGAEKADCLRLAAAFHESIHPRSGDEGLTPERAAAFLVNQKPSEHSPSALRRFLNEFSLFPPGSEIKLSNGRKAVAVRPHPGFPTRPTIELAEPGPSGMKLLDLREHPLLRIETPKDDSLPMARRKRRRRSRHGWSILGF